MGFSMGRERGLIVVGIGTQAATRQGREGRDGGTDLGAGEGVEAVVDVHPQLPALVERV